MTWRDRVVAAAGRIAPLSGVIADRLRSLADDEEASGYEAGALLAGWAEGYRRGAVGRVRRLPERDRELLAWADREAQYIEDAAAAEVRRAG